MEPTLATSKEFVGLAIGVGLLIAERVVTMAKALATKVKDNDSRVTTVTTTTHPSSDIPCEDLKYLRVRLDNHITAQAATEQATNQTLTRLGEGMAAVQTDVSWIRKRVENGGGKAI